MKWYRSVGEAACGFFSLIVRQVRQSSRQALLFILCVALSLTTLTAFSGLAVSVKHALLNDARKLNAADIIINSYATISTTLNRAIGTLVAEKQVFRANVHRFFSVVRSLNEDVSVLAALKVVDRQYPFYGQVLLASGRLFHEVLSPGKCIVAQGLLDRTGMKVGDRLKVGYVTLTIADVVTSEPDRSLNVFSFGPRVFVHHDDLDALGLIKKGSRIRRQVLLKIADQTRLYAIAAQLKQVARNGREQVDTFQTSGTRVKRFLDNVFFFLKLVGLFILLMAGLGIQVTLTALLKEKQQTIAIMKAVGASNGYIVRHFLSLVGVLGGVGTVLGIFAGIGVQNVLEWMMAPFLPPDLNFVISWAGVMEGVALGFGVVMAFSSFPLYRIKFMRPMMIFRRQINPIASTFSHYIAGIFILFFFFGLVLRHMQDVRFGIYFVGGIVALIFASALLTQVLLWIIKHCKLNHPALRQAVRALFRKGNATRSVIITLTCSLSVIFANYYIEKNLDAAFVQSYPETSPNVYFVDIQPDQKKAFLNEIRQDVMLHPIVRARVTAINAKAVNREAEQKKRRDNFSRVFNLTYRADLLADESLVKGEALFQKKWSDPQVSILDTVAQMHPMAIGDTIEFKIQGVPLSARISSIRTRGGDSLSPFFYFVFPENVLYQAPHTYFAALKISPDQLGGIQRRIVSRFPNISVIDVSQTINVLTRLMNQLSRIVRGFSFFSIGAGLLILISAINATRAERIIEVVYYKVLGAGKNFVFKVFIFENLLIGLFSSLPAVCMAQACAYWVCTVKLNIAYHPLAFPSFLMVLVVIFLVVVSGLAASRSIMGKRPITYLREHADD